MNTGVAIGGPLNGQQLSSELKMIRIPVKVGPDRGEGDRGFGSIIYKWFDGAWRMENTYEKTND